MFSQIGSYIQNTNFKPSKTKIKFCKNKKNSFIFYESNTIEYEKILAVLKGEIAGCIFRNVIPKSTCQKILKNFWASPVIGKRKDKVPAYNLGAYHFDKYLEEYFNEVDNSKIYLEKLFNNVENVYEKLVFNFENFLKEQNIYFRVAKYNKKRAGEFLIRSCKSEGREYIIKPHEDMAQCKNNKQLGFEIQKVTNYNIIAGNICLENNNGGNLYCWDFMPDDTYRKRLGVIGTGYPYPNELLENVQNIKLQVFPGDLYFLNGGNIHAVKSNESNTLSFRTTLSFFMGFINNNTIVRWT
ncbi:MAG: hypothetical protein IBJ00_02295 [Alphaproteobacteria bacterium]|nr:hypothetical protein [Alphaproteobacteria bacterium]